MLNKTSIIRRAHFNSAHRLHNPDWDDETNKFVYGKCNNPNFHGHNYSVEVKIAGFVDKQTGFVMNLGDLKRIIAEEVIERYDHKNLNLDCEDFQTLIPTAENIAYVIHENIKRRIDPSLDLTIRLYETERNIVEYPA